MTERLGRLHLVTLEAARVDVIVGTVSPCRIDGQQCSEVLDEAGHQYGITRSL